MNITPSSDVATKEKFNKALREGDESYKKLMEEVFRDVGWLTPEVLAGMRESDDFYCYLFAQIRSPSLHRGRVVLLGDAGYATPGIGTSLAIMGGYILAGEMLRHPGDYAMSLKNYEDLMAPFVKSQQHGANGMQYAMPQTQWGINIRNAIMGFVFGTGLDRLAIAGAAALGLSEKKLALPDYQWPAR